MSQGVQAVKLTQPYFSNLLSTAASGAAAFTPQGVALPTTKPPGATGGAVLTMFAAEIYVSNSGSTPVYFLPITGKTNVPEIPLYGTPRYPGELQGSTSEWQWVDPSTFPAATTVLGITIPAGAVAVPIRVESIGFSWANLTAGNLIVSAYGYTRRI